MSFPTIEARLAHEEFCDLMHDCIVPRPGGSRFDSAGHKITPLGVKRAAQLLGCVDATVRGKCSRESTNTNFTTRDVFILIAGGMDAAPLEPLLRLGGRMSCEVIEHDSIKDAYRAYLRITSQDGLIASTFLAAIDPASPGGSAFAPSERREMVKLLRELCSVARSLEDMFSKGAQR